MVETANGWKLVYSCYEPEHEGLRETLCALGNGYFVTRGAAQECDDDGVHYPGTYLAGGYNRVTSYISGRDISNEDLVNLPNWLSLKFKLEDDETWFRPDDVTLLDYKQELDLEHGMLHKIIRFRDAKGREIEIESHRLVSRESPHNAGTKTTLRPINWSGQVTWRSAINGQVKNNNVKGYAGLVNTHLKPVESCFTQPGSMFLEMQTSQSHLHIAMAVRTDIYQNDQPLACERVQRALADLITDEFVVDVSPENPVTIEKMMAVYTSRDRAISEAGESAREALSAIARFEPFAQRSLQRYEMLWKHFDIEIKLSEPEKDFHPHMLLRLHLFHLIQTLSLATIDLDVGAPARGWHGEAYRGHIFWDELFILPVITMRLPDMTRSLLLYRHRRLPKARQLAAQAGFRGAMFPWESASNGDEQTPPMYVDAEGKNWIPSATALQRHVNGAVAYNIWRYYQTTQDREFMSFYGAEIMFELARFWSDIAKFHKDSGRYEIHGVMGPDEYHTRYPGKGPDEPGINNNSYTNVLAAWVITRALHLMTTIPDDRVTMFRERFGITDEELAHWDEVSRKMKVVILDDGIITEFEGYENLKPLDLEVYRKQGVNLINLDRALFHEGKDILDYQVAKQADVMMLFYMFSDTELRETFERLGYTYTPEMRKVNTDYYLKRTVHGSSLSRLAYSWVLAGLDRQQSWELFTQALETDVNDQRGGTTSEGIHLGAMVGTIDMVIRGYTGIEVLHDTLYIWPRLPREVAEMAFQIRYRGHALQCRFTHQAVSISSAAGGMENITIKLGTLETKTLSAGQSHTFVLPNENDPKSPCIIGSAECAVPAS